MVHWQELTKYGFGEYIPICQRIDYQWIIDCLERDKYWEVLINNFKPEYLKWKKEYYHYTPEFMQDSFEDYMTDKVGTNWESDFFWYFKRCLTKFVFPRLSRILLQRPPWSDPNENYNAVDLLNRLSDRLLTAVIYLCIQNVNSAIYPIPPTGQSDLNLFYSLFDRAESLVDGNGVGTNNLSLNVPYTFKDSDVGMPVEFSGGSGEVDRTLGSIISITDELNAVINCPVPTSDNLTVRIFHHPMHENAKALVAGFAESYQGRLRTPGLRARLNALQHAAIYVNESEYDIHTIRWNQHQPDDTMHCDIYMLDFDHNPPIATRANTSFAGLNYNYTTKMIAMQYETIQNSGIHRDHLPLLPSDFENFGQNQAHYDQNGRPHVERLLSNKVRLSSAYHYPSGKAYVTAADGVLYAFTWTEYFGFAWVPWNQLDNADELKRPIDFLPPLSDNFTITDTLLGANERNYSYTGKRLGTDCVNIPGVGDRPAAVTWHWSAGRTLDNLTRIIGPNGSRGDASANFGVGKAFTTYQGLQSGIARYAPVDRVTDHAGAGVLRSIHGATADPITYSAGGGYWRHTRISSPADQASGRYVTSYNSVGVETANVGFSRAGYPAEVDWPYIIDENGSSTHRIEPWTPEQIAMCIFLGRHIVTELPHIGMRHHHGHSDTCPTRKVDTVAFPFARILRCVYPDQIIPDVWTQFYFRYLRNNNNRTTTHSRQFNLLFFGYDMGDSDDDDEPIQIEGVDGSFGNSSKLRLENFKTDRNSYRQELRDGGNNDVPVDIHVDRDTQETNNNEYWCTFTCWEMHDALVGEWARPND